MYSILCSPLLHAIFVLPTLTPLEFYLLHTESIIFLHAPISMASQLQKDYPWIQSPVIINAPMGGFARAGLATAVTLAGGIGLIGAVNDMVELEQNLQRSREIFSASKSGTNSITQQNQHSTNTNGDSLDPSATLPLGVGLLPFISKLDAALPLIKRYKPAIIWLFAATSFPDYAVWASAIRKASPQTKLWIQTGTVSAALEVARLATPDVLVMQGSDAGGHGFIHTAGIVSLIPEATDVLRREGFGHIPLVAAGGIVDGRGVAAALTLGAAGAVMGTRFLAATETEMNPLARETLLAARDGALSTAKSTLFDQLKGPSMWPELYDGRALASGSWKDFSEKRVGLEEVQRRFKDAEKKEDKGFAGGMDGRAAVWAGTGVGMVNEMKSAEEVVKETRAQAVRVLEGLRSSL